MFISEHTSSGMCVNIDIELSILSMLYNQAYILYLSSCTYYIKYCIIIIIISGTLYTHTALLVKILYVLVVLVISPLGF